MNKTYRYWEKFGKEDPYFWVTTNDKFKDIRDAESLNQFFREGKDYICNIFKIIQNRLNRNFSPTRVLDFGCGAGRVLLPLSDMVDEAVGMDISPTLLNVVEKHKEEKKKTNISLFLSDEKLSLLNGKFDFIHSIYVFQHIPTEQGLSIFRRLIKKLNKDGVAMIHFVYESDITIFRKFIEWTKSEIPYAIELSNILHGRKADTPYMEMYNYPLKKVFRTLHELNINHIYTRYTKDGCYRGVMLFIQKSANDDDFIMLPEIP